MPYETIIFMQEGDVKGIRVTTNIEDKIKIIRLVENFYGESHRLVMRNKIRNFSDTCPKDRIAACHIYFFATIMDFSRDDE